MESERGKETLARSKNDNCDKTTVSEERVKKNWGLFCLQTFARLSFLDSLSLALHSALLSSRSPSGGSRPPPKPLQFASADCASHAAPGARSVRCRISWWRTRRRVSEREEERGERRSEELVFSSPSLLHQASFIVILPAPGLCFCSIQSLGTVEHNKLSRILDKLDHSSIQRGRTEGTKECGKKKKISFISHQKGVKKKAESFFTSLPPRDGLRRSDWSASRQ